MENRIDADTELTWYALRVPPRQSLMILTMNVLRNQGLIADIAMEKRLRRKTKWDKQRKHRQFVTAPGYLFAAVPAGRPFPWQLVFSYHMIHAVVAINGQPAELSDKAVRSFLRWDGDKLPSYMRYMKTGAEFGPGDRVYLTDTALADWSETAPLPVDKIEDGKASFIVQLLGKTVELKVPVDQCVKAA